MAQEFNVGEIVCELWWNESHKATVKLPFVPQIGSHIILEDDDDEPMSMKVLGTSVSAKRVSPNDFEKLSDSAKFVNFVKILLKFEGMAKVCESEELPYSEL